MPPHDKEHGHDDPKPRPHGPGHHPGGGHGEHEESGAPEWLISFADNVALLMGFFVILLAMNMAKPKLGGIGGSEKNPATVESPEMLDFILSVREAFKTPVKISSTDPNDAALVKRLRERANQGRSSHDAPDGTKHDVQAPRPTDYVERGGSVMFEFASASVSEAGRGVILRVAEQFRGRRNVVEVRGHASAAEAMRSPERGMELAHQRAMTVARSLADAGVQWPLLRVVACGENDPIHLRADTADEHRSNQRVEIVMTKELAAPDQFSQERPPDPPRAPAPTPVHPP